MDNLGGGGGVDALDTFTAAYGSSICEIFYHCRPTKNWKEIKEAIVLRVPLLVLHFMFLLQGKSIIVEQMQLFKNGTDVVSNGLYIN